MGAGFAAFLRAALAARGGSVRGATERAGLPNRSIQSVLEGHVPTIDRAAEICEALGLTFTIGAGRRPESPRGDAQPELSVSFNSEGADAGPEPPRAAPDEAPDPQLARLQNAVREHWSLLESPYAREMWIADVFRSYPALRALQGTSKRGREKTGRRDDR